MPVPVPVPVCQCASVPVCQCASVPVCQCEKSGMERPQAPGPHEQCLMSDILFLRSWRLCSPFSDNVDRCCRSFRSFLLPQDGMALKKKTVSSHSPVDQRDKRVSLCTRPTSQCSKVENKSWWRARKWQTTNKVVSVCGAGSGLLPSLCGRASAKIRKYTNADSSKRRNQQIQTIHRETKERQRLAICILTEPANWPVLPEFTLVAIVMGITMAVAMMDFIMKMIVTLGMIS